MARPGRNTHAWAKVVAQVKAEEHRCHLCHKIIDWDLPQTSPWSGTVDHLIPLDLLHPDDPRREDRANARAAHRRCNSKRGNRPLVAQPSRDW